jgi:phosphinothricin acetyltransferase
MEFVLLQCGKAQLPEILEIINEAILNSTSLYVYEPRDEAYIRQWYVDKLAGNYPVLGLTDQQGQLLGFGSYGPFRNFPAYKFTVEHSVYIKKGYRGKGLGLFLLQALIEQARSQDYHLMIGAIDSCNQVSIHLHEKLGFSHCGTIHEVGYKFNRWLDLCLYQLKLNDKT